MPKVNTPEVSKGFWVAAGVFLFLLIVNVLAYLVMQARKKTSGS